MLKSLAEWADSGSEFAAVEFGFSVPLLAALAALVVVGGLSVWFWWPRLRLLQPSTRSGLTALRVGALVLVLFLAFDPQLIARKREPTKNFVALLYDDSRSMTLDDGDGQTRGGHLVSALTAQKADFEDVLRETFQVVEYRFGHGAERVSGASGLGFTQSESRIADAVRSAERDMEGVSLAAVIVFSDGVEQPQESMGVAEEVSPTPVFTVGTGRKRAWSDLEIAHLTVAQTPFDKSPVALTVHTAATGLAGNKAVVEVLQDSRVVATAPLDLVKEEQENQIRVEFIPQGDTWTAYTARVRLAETGPATLGPAVSAIAVAGKDMVVENNVRDFLVDNRKKEYRILYFSGRPNWENKFVARALGEDEELHLSSLLRIRGPEVKFTYRGKRSSLTNPLFEGFDNAGGVAPRYDEAVFVRIGVKDNELANGYPLNPEELYGYDLVILGDIEADFFSQGHFETTRDFVSERGGALLVMGGPHAFAAGGYGGTMLEPLLPVVLPEQDKGIEVAELFQVKPTVEGFLSGMWSMQNDIESNAQAWNEMAPLFGASTFPLARAGSTVWARMGSDNPTLQDEPLFVRQRYGEGLCAVMATGETWTWQMNADKDDNRHERFWRQAVRSLIKDVKDPVVPRLPQADLTVDTEIPLTFQVRDKLYHPREGLRTTIELTTPGGSLAPLAVSESLEESGIYAADFVPSEPGLYVAHLLSVDGEGNEVARTEQGLLVHPDTREYQQAQFNPDYLMGLSEKTGGAYYELNDLAALVDAIPLPPGDEALTKRIHLWQWPLFYALLVVLLCVEWFWRRKAGQP